MRKSASPSRRQQSTQLIQLPNIPKSSSHIIKSPKILSPPPNLSTIPQDLLIKISNSAIGFSKEQDSKTILDNNLILDYLQVISKISETNKVLTASIPFILRPSWKNITTINLNNLKINMAILSVLNMTIRDKITTIILQGISFDTDNTRNNFFEIFKTFNNLQRLEISKCVLFDRDFNVFITILINSKSLKYLTFTKNTVDSIFFSNLFTEDPNNEILLNGKTYKIYVFNFRDKYSIKIVGGNNFSINILGNIGVGVKYDDYPNNFER
jgi:hypothetical protein